MLPWNEGHIAMLAGVFLVTFSVVLGLVLLLAPQRARGRVESIEGFGGIGGRGSPSATGDSGDNPWVERLAKWSKPISKLSLPKEGWESSTLRTRFINAGWRDASAPALYFAAKTLLALALPFIGFEVASPHYAATHRDLLMGLLVLLGAIGYYLPNMVLSRRIAWRQGVIFEDFPDALDLMTVCVEAGLSLDAALMRVAGEIHVRSPLLSDEFELLLLELRSGFSKEQALRNLSLRTGVEDIDTFVSMLIQAERFGTSVGASLRVLSEMLRTKRRLRAEERAARIALKLLFPLVFFIFPTLLLVLLGPALIQIYRVLLPTLSGSL
ncbi:type II secretion system F family protein [Pandoraea pulmonicola]|uniref:Flp pilus assembly protein TadB n=1 Tax=Pandoraea pulmonicola TaxID=93221 RepID=A0AAJ5D0L8_PANPU|nr:type II secretion system F family protein [Pandoraea pulmonicola]AJC20715.1 type II secretion system protein [Pandoraea pulmonicola]SUA90772.1 Flp pilus assembly protein TadB [Pandoraea pulmonicola]